LKVDLTMSKFKPDTKKIKAALVFQVQLYFLCLRAVWQLDIYIIY